MDHGYKMTDEYSIELAEGLFEYQFGTHSCPNSQAMDTPSALAICSHSMSVIGRCPFSIFETLDWSTDNPAR